MAAQEDLSEHGFPLRLSMTNEDARLRRPCGQAPLAPDPDMATSYRHDGQEIPDPGVIAIGKIDAGEETLNVEGPSR